MSENVRQHLVELTDGTVLAVQETGLENGPALLMLAGQSNSHHWWDGLRDHFDDRFRVLTYDQRGTGQTRAAEEDGTSWSTRQFSGDVAVVLETLGVSRAHVYGASMGGRIAQWLAVNRPDLVQSLILACSSPGGVGAAERKSPAARMLMNARGPERIHVLLDLFYTPEWRTLGLRSNLLGDPDMSQAAKILHMKMSRDHDAGAFLGQITAPTLVLHGGEDLMSPAANGDALASGISGARLFVVPRGRHGFFDEFAAEVNAVVDAFLEANGDQNTANAVAQH